MMKFSVRGGFTLLEVNLAIFIMATGVLVMCGLYSMGFRENRQSVEDVAGAAFADAYLGPLVQGLSATNMQWSSWVQIGNKPGDGQAERVIDGVIPKSGNRLGWGAYVETGKNDDGSRYYRVSRSWQSLADGAFNDVRSRLPSPYNGSAPSIPSDYCYALVVTRRGASIQLAFRVSRRRDSLLSQQVFVSEVHFQGVVE